MTRIFCPLCGWRPTPMSRWACWPGCRTSWNTFDTRGQCPGCRKQWYETQCLRCHQLSPHEAWYHDDGADDVDVTKQSERDRELVPV